MKKDELSKDFEDMLVRFPFIEVRFERSINLEAGQLPIMRDEYNRVILTFTYRDTDEEVVDKVMKCIEVAEQVQLDLIEDDAYKMSNPKLLDRLSYIASKNSRLQRCR